MLLPLVLWATRAGRDVAAVGTAALPWQRMTRTGLSLGFAFLPLYLAGKPEEAVVAAIFGNLLAFTDQAGPLNERLAVIAGAAVTCAVAGCLGALTDGHPAWIVPATLILAFGAGLVHSWVPGIEMIPRQALICFVACAYLPLVNPLAGVGALVGTGCVLVGALVDGILRKTLDSPRFVEARQGASFPGPRFGLVYAGAVAMGLVIGEAIGVTRSYWVAITTLVVLVRDRHVSLVRAVQRLVGTLAGVIVAFVLIRYLAGPATRGIFVAAILILPFLWHYGLVRNYAVGIMLISVWVLLLIDLGLPSEASARDVFQARLADTAIGCAIAILGTILVGRTLPKTPA